MKNMYPLKFNHCYTYTIWGGQKLAAIRSDPRSHGTSWDISSHPHADNTVTNGEYAGKHLSELLDEYPEEMLGQKKRSQMLRVSIIDAAESLSIQVHPTDDYAHVHEKDEEGKSEAWYIMDADPGSQLIAGTTAANVDEVKQAVAEDRLEEIVVRHNMENGDFIYIEAGQMHAFGSGMMGLEISEYSDTTYRFYDFHRKDEKGHERPLHLKQCYDVLDCARQCKKISHPIDKRISNKRVNLVREKAFSADILDVDGEYVLQQDHTGFYCLSNVRGGATLCWEGGEMPLVYAESVFIPAACSDIRLSGDARIVISYVEP